MKKIYDKWIMIYSLFFSIMILFTSKTICGDIFSKLNETYIKSFRIFDILIVIITFILTYILFYLITSLLDKIKFANRKRGKNLKLFIIILISLIVLWLPYILSFYPGGLFPDTYSSIGMAIDKIGWDNHNPIMYGLVWMFIIKIVQLFTNNPNIPLFCFTLLQCLLMGLASTTLIYYMYKKGYNKVLIIVSYLFFAIFPLVPLYVISLWKDTLFSIWIFVYSLFLIYILNGDNYIDKITNKLNTFIYLILIFLVAFSRNNGSYIAALTTFILVLYLFSKERSKRVKFFSLVSISSILLIFIIQGPIYNKLNLNVDKKVESLGVPIQQIAYIVSFSDNIAKDDVKVINNLMPIEIMKEKYTPALVDVLKWDKSFNLKYLNNESGNIMKTYTRLIIKHPVMAVKAYALQTIGYWNIKETSNEGYAQTSLWEDNTYTYVMKDKVKEIFGFSMLNILTPKKYINYAIFIWIMLYTIIYLLHRKKYKILIVVLPNLFVWLTIMMATPIAFSLRYVFSIVLSLPIYLLCIFNKE